MSSNHERLSVSEGLFSHKKLPEGILPAVKGYKRFVIDTGQ